MSSDRLRERIVEQFSHRSDRSDIWGVFDLFLRTGSFLNLGYSKWYQPHVVGSCQRRLATTVGRTLSDHLARSADTRLLDVGCGRGGPAIHLTDQCGFDVTGIDLVPHNVARARENAARRDVDAEFVVGDATRLPFASGSLDACVAIDSLVYLPDRQTVYSEIADVLDSDGVVVVSDLVARETVTERERRTITRFAEAWDMSRPGTVTDHEDALDGADLEVVTVRNITPNSVGRFRKWTTLFSWLYATPASHVVNRLLRRRGLDPTAVIEQVRRAHDALPALRHVILVARK